MAGWLQRGASLPGECCCSRRVSTRGACERLSRAEASGGNVGREPWSDSLMDAKHLTAADVSALQVMPTARRYAGRVPRTDRSSNCLKGNHHGPTIKGCTAGSTVSDPAAGYTAAPRPTERRDVDFPRGAIDGNRDPDRRPETVGSPSTGRRRRCPAVRPASHRRPGRPVARQAKGHAVRLAHARSWPSGYQGWRGPAIPAQRR